MSNMQLGGFITSLGW